MPDTLSQNIEQTDAKIRPPSRSFIEGLTLGKTDCRVMICSHHSNVTPLGVILKGTLYLLMSLWHSEAGNSLLMLYDVLAHACFIFPRLSLVLSSGPAALY